MNAEHATVTVQYVNQPKGAAVSGSIKDANGDYYGVHKSALNRFQEGGKYEFEFRTSDSGFRNVDVKTIQPVMNGGTPRGQYEVHEQRQPVAAAPQPQAVRPTQYRQPVTPAEAKSMFRTSCVNAAIQSRQVVLTRDGIAALIVEIDAAYDMAAGE
jgi:hypothetical protein